MPDHGWPVTMIGGVHCKVVDCTTAEPASTERIAEALAARNVRFADAPLTRSPKDAEKLILHRFSCACHGAGRRARACAAHLPAVARRSTGPARPGVAASSSGADRRRPPRQRLATVARAGGATVQPAGVCSE